MGRTTDLLLVISMTRIENCAVLFVTVSDRFMTHRLSFSPDFGLFCRKSRIYQTL